MFYEAFNLNFHFNLNEWKDISIRYIFPVALNEDELYKYDPNSEYYSDNCSVINELSIYDRKKEYNDKNLSLCQANFNFNNYDINTKKVTCDCLASDSNDQNDELLNKFVLREEDKDKCVIEKETGMTENIKFCDIYEIFNENRNFTINLETAN